MMYIIILHKSPANANRDHDSGLKLDGHKATNILVTYYIYIYELNTLMHYYKRYRKFLQRSAIFITLKQAGIRN